MRRSALRGVALVLGGLLLVAVAVGAPGDGRGDPLDPDGTGPQGAKALVLLLGALADVEVVRGPPPADASTAVVLLDALDEDDREGVLRWVEAGGVLVVGDPGSPLADAAVDGPCPAALAGVDRIHAGGAELRRDGRDGSCFEGFARFDDRGDGFVVALASADPFTNELLGEGDDAVLAAALLAPQPGSSVAVLHGAEVAPASGDDTLVDLVGSSVLQALGLAGLAVGLWVLFRARRLGRPVVEEQPVAVAGSELVVAVGRLLDGRRRPDEAAATLRADVRRAAIVRLGLPADADTRTLAAAVAARTGVDEGRAAAALGDRAVASDDDLLAVIADLDRIRADLLGRTRT